MYTDGERACVYIAGGRTSLDKKRKRYSRGEICCAREGMGVSRRVEGEGDGERERESAESPPPVVRIIAFLHRATKREREESPLSIGSQVERVRI